MKNNNHLVQRNISSSLLCIIVIATAIVVVAAAVVYNQSLQFHIVHGTSMVPALHLGDLLVVDTKVGFNDVKPGDIIVYRTYDPEFYNMLATHRMVASYHESDGTKYIITKGDNNAISEPLLDYPICAEQYQGKVIHRIPWIGLPQVWLKNLNTIDTLPTPLQIQQEAMHCN